MPLYDILNEFQKGHSHMAIVVKQCNKMNGKSDDKTGDGICTSVFVTNLFEFFSFCFFNDIMLIEVLSQTRFSERCQN